MPDVEVPEPPEELVPEPEDPELPEPLPPRPPLPDDRFFRQVLYSSANFWRRSLRQASYSSSRDFNCSSRQ